MSSLGPIPFGLVVYDGTLPQCSTLDDFRPSRGVYRRRGTKEVGGGVLPVTEETSLFFHGFPGIRRVRSLGVSVVWVSIPVPFLPGSEKVYEPKKIPELESST